MFVSSQTDSIFVTLTGFIDNAISFNFGEKLWSGMALPSKDIVPYLLLRSAQTTIFCNIEHSKRAF
jgi:hypothetical protein